MKPLAFSLWNFRGARIGSSGRLLPGGVVGRRNPRLFGISLGSAKCPGNCVVHCGLCHELTAGAVGRTGLRLNKYATPALFAPVIVRAANENPVGPNRRDHVAETITWVWQERPRQVP